MDTRKIKKLIELMMEADLEAIEVKEGDQSIALKRRSTVIADPRLVAAAPQPTAVASAPVQIGTSEGPVETAPMVGVFYAAPNPGEPAFIKVGQKLNAGDTIGIIEAMKIMNPVVATQSGTITEILVKNGEVIQFGQPMVRLQG